MARLFSGSGQYISNSTGPTFTFNVGISVYTLVAWFNPSALPSSGNDAEIFDFNGTAGHVPNLRLYIHNTAGTSQLIAADRDGGGNDVKAICTPTLSTSTWYHAAGIYTSVAGTTTATVDGYLNGGNHATASFTIAGLLGTGAGFEIAAILDVFNMLNGAVADCAIWNVALTTGQIAALAGGARPSSIPTGLIGYWPLAGTTSPEPDTSGGGNNGTLTGSPTQTSDPPAFNTAAFRRSLSSLGTRSGSRQMVG